MRASTPHYRNLQQAMQSQSFPIEVKHFETCNNPRQQPRRERVAKLVDWLWSPERSQQAAA
jgi:hypothetical protein